MKKNTNANRGPGRPMYAPKFPRSLMFTMTAFCEANGVNPETGKGKNCSKLTLIKFLGRKQGKSLVARLKATAEPNSDTGLGRKPFLFCMKDRLDEAKAKIAEWDAKAKAKETPKAKAPRKARTPKTVTVDVGVSQTTQDYEAQKAALLAPTVAPVITPDPTPAPEATPAVAEDNAPAPEAVAAETAAVAAEATAPEVPVTA